MLSDILENQVTGEYIFVNAVFRFDVWRMGNGWQAEKQRRHSSEAVGSEGVQNLC